MPHRPWWQDSYRARTTRGRPYPIVCPGHPVRAYSQVTQSFICPVNCLEIYFDMLGNSVGNLSRLSYCRVAVFDVLSAVLPDSTYLGNLSRLTYWRLWRPPVFQLTPSRQSFFRPIPVLDLLDGRLVPTRFKSALFTTANLANCKVLADPLPLRLRWSTQWRLGVQPNLCVCACVCCLCSCCLPCSFFFFFLVVCLLRVSCVCCLFACCCVSTTTHTNINNSTIPF